MKERALVLVHWHAGEAEELAGELRAVGWTVASVTSSSLPKLSDLRQNSPSAVVISLRRLPSHGREVADALWYAKWGRKIPIVFVDGDEERVRKTRERFPQAVYTTWEGLPGVLGRIGRWSYESGLPADDAG